MLSSLSGAALVAAPAGLRAQHRLWNFRLRAAPAAVRLAPEPYPATPAWCYNGKVPGPGIRVRRGERLRIELSNGLDEETTLHAHGIRLPNAMDGVSHLTQVPIAPGETFIHEFDAIDAGTFWYHPRQRCFEQVGRGLYGPLVIEEARPPRFDRELSWVLDDWRLTRKAAISDDFGDFHDLGHAGRPGNTVTIKGKVPERVAVRPGERLRLRLVNAANARILALDFGAAAPRILAYDGQPVTPHAPGGGLVVLGPAMRADVVLDIPAEPGLTLPVTDRAYRNGNYALLDLEVTGESFRAAPLDAPVALPANPLPEPDLATARRHGITFTGGMMGAMVERAMGIESSSGMTGMRHEDGGIWFINGKAARGHVLEPFLTLERDATHVLEMTDATAFPHPIHLHGHSFRVLSRNGRSTDHREWQDTVLMAPRERVEIAFVADNPGDWMFHCHILEHQAAGMMGVVRGG